MRTEVPVIFAAFDGKLSDQELSYDQWKARSGHGIDLTFTVKTIPGRLEGLEVSVEHLHLQGDKETQLSKFKAPDVEIGKPYSVRLQGSQPGINRFRLRISYKDANGKVTEQEGFSHWVVVQ